MSQLSITSVAALFAAVVLPPPFDEMPVDSGAIFVYGLLAVSGALVLYFGMKKPKGQ